VWGYATGVVLSLALAALAGRLSPRRLNGLRAAILLAVFGAVAVLPLAINVASRARGGPGTYAQSETIIIEEAAKQLVSGHDPHMSDYSHGPLAARPLGTKTHFPYLPGMTVFGLMAAAGTPLPLGDARLGLAATALIAALAALSIARAQPSEAIRALQVLFVLPTGALALAGGGDDVTVLALMVLALALIRSRRPFAGGVAMGVAVSLKQIAVLLLPFLLLAARGRDGGSRRGASAAAALAVMAPTFLTFVLWSPGAFVEDVVRFPLGLSAQSSPAQGPSVGRLLLHAFPGAGTLVALGGMAVVAVTAVYLVVRRPPRTASMAALYGALLLALAGALAPVSRMGYLAYPLVLAVWARVVLPERSGRLLQRDVAVLARRYGFSLRGEHP
jgi:glycosyl transferase family 87